MKPNAENKTLIVERLGCTWGAMGSPKATKNCGWKKARERRSEGKIREGDKGRESETMLFLRSLGFVPLAFCPSL